MTTTVNGDQSLICHERGLKAALWCAIRTCRFRTVFSTASPDPPACSLVRFRSGGYLPIGRPSGGWALARQNP
eukprot:745197-Alexandrium_andersonii.AAC.1